MTSPEMLIDVLPKYGRAEAFIEHFESRDAEPDSIATVKFLNIIGSGWYLESIPEDNGATINALVRPLPRNIDEYDDDSYLVEFEEQGGDMRVTSNGLEIRAEKLGIKELRAALELERVCSPELADAEVKDGPTDVADEILRLFGETTVNLAGKDFISKLPPYVARALMYMDEPIEVIAERLGVNPPTVNGYLYKAKIIGGFEKRSDLREFAKENGLLLETVE
jgi:hypothetical protein